MKYQNLVGVIPALLFSAGMVATPVQAKVSAEEAKQIGLTGTPLTPLGAERAGNAEGTIPEWTGGITEYPEGYVPGGWYVDPFADDEILFTITAQNYKQYADKLTPGTQALFERYPDSFEMNVYPTRRSASFPDWYYENSVWNASNTEFVGSDDPTLAERSVKKESFKPGVWFPIPKTAGEALWNHTYFYWGKSFKANSYGINVFADGTYADHMKVDRWIMVWAMQDDEIPESDYFKTKGGGALWCGSQEDVYPPRTAGQMFGGCNTWEQNDFDAYLYIPGQRRVRKAPEIGFYDSPGSGSDGLRTADQRFLWAITGGEEWYEFDELKKAEYYVPYNSYKMAQPGVTFDDLARPGHLNPEYKRYELHRAWVVEGRTRPQFRHLSPHRSVYSDEDTWAALSADMYDAQDKMWRVSESYNINFYDHKLNYFWGDAHMDIISGRYACVNSFYNIGIKDGNKPPVFDGEPSWTHQTPAGLRKHGVR